MAATLDNYLDLLQQKKAFADLATIMPDGTPQVTPVWFDYLGGKVRVNTAKGRVKARNLKPGVPVALAIMDPDNSYRYVQIRGRVVRRKKAAPTLISTHWPRNISARTSIRFAVLAKCGSCTRSNRSRFPA